MSSSFVRVIRTRVRNYNYTSKNWFSHASGSALRCLVFFLWPLAALRLQLAL